KSHAATPWSGALSVGPPGSGYCMDAPSVATGANVVLNKCNNKIDQKWELVNAGTVSGGGKTINAYTIQNLTAGTSECVDDWKSSSMQGKNNLLRLYTCKGTDFAQRFFWAGDGHQLKSTGGSGLLCIDDLG